MKIGKGTPLHPYANIHPILSPSDDLLTCFNKIRVLFEEKDKEIVELKLKLSGKTQYYCQCCGGITDV